jgi:hypothetical protein
MCARFDVLAVNPEYVRDCYRRRLGNYRRWQRLADYCQARWTKSRALRHSAEWYALQCAIKRRRDI